MVGGRLCCLSCFFRLSAVLFLGVCLPDVEASSCQSTIHKKVGDTVEFSSCLPAEGVTLARWKHGETTVADKVKGVTEEFKNRFSLNPINFSLTVKKLTLRDSGEFSFVSEVNDKQRETVSITLQVHEPITKEPDLTVNSTWDDFNKSCTVSLMCSSTSDRNVSYSWSVRDKTQNGSRLQFNIRPDEGETTFTCTISDFISEKSASKIVKCSNDTESEQEKLIFILSVAVGGCLVIVIIVGIALGLCHCKKKPAGNDSNDMTVYADVAEIAVEGGTSTMKPCSVYETIDNRIHPVTPVTSGPQTVYDKIQLSRVRKASSPYQEI